MQNQLHVVGIQADLIWENPKKNTHEFEKIIATVSDDIDLIVLPEMFTSGFTMNPENVAEKMEGPTLEWMKKIAVLKNTAITGSLVIEEKRRYFNRLVFVHPSGEIDMYDKRHSFSLAGEHEKYTAGTQKIIIDYKGWKICPLICYDLRFPVWSRNAENYDLIIYMANWPITRIKAWETLLKARAIENMSYTIGVNRVGVDYNRYEYSGNSLIVDYLGEELSSLKPHKKGILEAIFHKTAQDAIREKLGFLDDQDSFEVFDT